MCEWCGASGRRLFLLVLLSIVPLCSAQAQDWKTLNQRAGQLYDQGKYAQALSLAQQALRLAQAKYGAESSQVSEVLTQLGSVYEALGRYAEAERADQQALALDEKLEDPNDPDIAADLNNLAELYTTEGRNRDAEPLYQRALAIDEKALGKDDPALATDLNNLAQLYDSEGRYAEAEPLYRRAIALEEKKLGKDAPDLASTLGNLAGLYETLGRYAEAEPLYQRALAIDEKAHGKEHPDVAIDLGNLAQLYEDEGRYAEAEALYQRARSIDEKRLGKQHHQFAVDLSNLAELYMQEGRYPEAEALYLHARAIDEKALSSSHPDLATDVNNLGLLYETLGRYAEAEPLFQQAAQIDEKAYGPDHPELAIDLNNLAVLYLDEGRYGEAEPLLERVLAIHQKKQGADHPAVAIALSNLATVARRQGRYPEAEKDYQRALVIDQKALGEEHPETARDLSNLANLYDDEGKFDQAEPLCRRALALREKLLGPEHPDVGLSLNNLAWVLEARGQYEQAEPLFRRALAISRKTVGDEHPGTALVLDNLAVLKANEGDYRAAGPLFDQVIANLAHQFQYHFTYMTEQQRLEFLTTVSYVFPSYFSFCYSYRQQEPELLGKMYDLVLWEKGFVGASIAALRSKIAASGDPEALRLLDQLTAKKTELAALLTQHPADRERWKKQVAQLEAEADELERKLVERSAALSQEKKLGQASWRDVQKALKPGEAAVEIVDFRFRGKQSWTKTYYYVALIITPETREAPQMVVLGEAGRLEGASLMEYQAHVQERGQELVPAAPAPAAPAPADFYQTYWQPLEAALAGSSRLYLSPDGVFNQMPLGLIPLPDGRLLMEKYDLRLLSSTKDLLRPAAPSAGDTAVLIGNPQFDLSVTQQRAALRDLATPEEPHPVLMAALSADDRSRDQGSGGALKPLPGTGTEIQEIGRLLQQHQWQGASYTGARALEEALKRVQHPRLLHVATHGFFLPDQERRLGRQPTSEIAGTEDPMLRSGLFLAGADRALAGQPSPEDLDDGVLTAYEATGLDLEGTELVVLSACETGRGDVRNGEGVFGLRRALQEAGAQDVLMTLWSVPDAETQELMALFYSKWLGGMEKHQALRQAQMEMRARVQARYGADLPYYWGAFVLVGR